MAVSDTDGPHRHLLRQFVESKRSNLGALIATGARVILHDSGSLTIYTPVRHPEHGYVCGMKKRQLPEHTKGSVNGSTFPIPFVAGESEEPARVLICEGETDMMRLLGLDPAALIVSMPTGAARWADEWNALIQEGVPVYACLDNPAFDKPMSNGRKASDVGRAKIAKAFPEARAAIPPGVSDWCEWDGDCEAFAKLLAEAPPAAEAVGRGTFDFGKPVDGIKWPKLNDYGMARALIDSYPARIRHVNELDEWITNVGDRWLRGRTAEQLVKQAAMRALTGLPGLAAGIDPENEYRGALLHYAAKNTTRSRRDAMIDVAASEPDVMIGHEELDTHRHLLACANGIIDLRTGELLPHDPALLITRASPVAYRPEAGAPRFLRFLEEVFPGAPDVIGYMRRCFGYYLTGEVLEELFWIWYGRGGNGKSKLALALEIILGHDLAVGMDFASFMPSRRDGAAASPDIARLNRVRVAVAQEKSKGKPLDEAIVKKLTGQDRVVARHLYKGIVEFDPHFKIVMACNDKPGINATEAAMRRRVQLVPFLADFTENPDQHIPKHFRAEAEGTRPGPSRVPSSGTRTASESARRCAGGPPNTSTR